MTTPGDISLSRRGFLAGSARTALTSAAVAAAAGAALWPVRPRSRRDAPPDRTVIRYWEKWTGVEGQALQRIVDGFNQSQSRIWVERLAVSDENSKAMVAVAGGDPPDVIGLFSYSVPQYAQAGAAIPLADLGADPGEDHYAPAIRRTLSMNVGGQERLFAGANTCYSLALYCNLDHFAEAKLRPPETIEELLETAVAMTRRDASGKIERCGFLPILPWWWPYLWPVSFAGASDPPPLYDETTNRCTVATEHAIRAFEWFAEFPRRLGLDSVQAFVSAFAREYHNTHDPFLSGHCSMAFQGPWLANFARTYAPDLKYTVVPMPPARGATPGVGLVECDVLMIPRGCPHPEAAAEFVRYTQRREVQEQLCRDHAKPSPLATESDGFRRGHPHPDIGIYADLIQSPKAFILPRTRAWKQYEQILNPAAERIWRGANVRAELTAVAAQTQPLLDKTASLAAKAGRGA